MKIPIEVSARHIHLSKEDLEKLFGKGYKLKKMKKLYQPSDFSAQETVAIAGRANRKLTLRVIGPVKKKTQIELSKTDAIFLGFAVPLRNSGDLKGTSGAVLTGPTGKIAIKEGVINTWRHIHCTPKEAKKLGLKNGQMVSVKTDGPSALTFHNVLIRISKNYKLCLHLDTDEGNACGIVRKGEGNIVI